MSIAISRTRPFRHLQSRIGSATYRLNTVLVGLELVAAGGAKLPSLPVTWTKPGNPQLARQAANQAEIFACTAAIVLTVDVFDQFLRNLANEDWLLFGPEARDIATKAKPRSKSQGGEYSIAERTVALYEDLFLEVGPAVAAVDLLCKWRNSAVHNFRRSKTISDEFKKKLIESRHHFYDHYSHLDISLAVSNFEAGKTPVPKEATSLIAAAQNVSRTLDEAAIRRAAGTSNDVEIAADRILARYFSDTSRKLSGWAEITEALQGSEERRRKNLAKIMERVGLTSTKEGARSATLSDRYVEELMLLDRSGFSARFLISKTEKL